MKDPTLWPSNVEKWKQLLHITLGLLGDPSTFSESAACTIARNVMFCYDDGTADLQLSRRLKLLFEHMGSGQTDTRKPLNCLFAVYLGHFDPLSTWYLHGVIASLHNLYSLASSSSTLNLFLSKICLLCRLTSPFDHALSTRANRKLVTQQPRRLKKAPLRLLISADSVTETDHPPTSDRPPGAAFIPFARAMMLRGWDSLFLDQAPLVEITLLTLTTWGATLTSRMKSGAEFC